MRRRIYIRAESNPDEHRAPLVPRDIPRLVEAGFQILVQRSATRIYEDADYAAQGACLTEEPWYEYDRTVIVVGLKEISRQDLHNLDGHTHVYFSHSFNQQRGAEEILQSFALSKSRLYDFEYFVTADRRRYLSFGYYAGICGAMLGLLQWSNRMRGQSSLASLCPWPSLEDALCDIEKAVEGLAPPTLGIAVIGGLRGECVRGVCHVLGRIQYGHVLFDRSSDKRHVLHDHDLVFNCIKLEASSTEDYLPPPPPPIVGDPVLIVDISCDVYKDNHPLRHVYNAETTWEQPVIHQKNCHVISISNLPSLLPRESSDAFSKRCASLFLQPMYNEVWRGCADAFRKQIQT
jgi:saccharopine dehydrogenase (NAD+, L-lysine-forming)